MRKMILLHGALGCASLFEPLEEVLKGQYNTHTFNFSGHGKRPFNAEGFGIEFFAEELKSFIKSNKLKGADIFGYSMGGYVALYLASQEPELIGKIFTLGTKFGWNSESAEHEVSRLNPELIEEKVPAFAKVLAERHGKKEWKKLVWQTAGMMLELGDEPLLTQETLASIQNPTVLLLGDEDEMVSKEESEKTANALPHGKFITIENSPHPLEKVNPKTLAKHLQ